MEKSGPSRLLPRCFFDRSPEVVAQELLGKILVRRYQGEEIKARLSETEAYLGLDDPASHAAVGRTPRNAVLFGPPGFAYVYFVYGMHFCLNVSCLPDGEPGGVLFRALQPLQGIDTMRQLRHGSATASARQLTDGPGKLCQALAVTRENSNGLDFTAQGSPLQLHEDGYQPKSFKVTPRVGIRAAADRPLRFLIAEEATPRRSARRKLSEKDMEERSAEEDGS